MIPENFIEAWREQAKWQNILQVEQDLVISRALVDLYNEPHIQDALVFRGGTLIISLKEFLKSLNEDVNFISSLPEGGIF